MKRLTRQGYLIEEQGMTYLAEAAPGQWPGPSSGTNSPLDYFCPGSAYRIALEPRAG